jgi:hypothetical protein
MDYPAEHTLVDNDPQRKIIDWKGVILTLYNLRRHIPGRATGILIVIRLRLPGHPQVRNPQIPLIIDDQILRLDVPMDDAIRMQVLQPDHNTASEELHDVLLEVLVLAQVVPEVAAGHQVHYQEQVVAVLKREVHIHEEWVFELGQ